MTTRLRHLFSILVFALLWPALVRAAATYEVVSEFERPGTSPMGKMVYVPSTGFYYGTTNTGGLYDLGTIFKMDQYGVKTTLLSFTGANGSVKGANPEGGMILASDGNLYGTTSAGGGGGFGTIFKCTPAGTFTTIIEFSGSSGLTRGAVPNEILQAADGSLYGTTQAGGTHDAGTMYKCTPVLPPLVTLLSTLVDFSGTTAAPRGDTPVGALVSDGSGNFYGVTQVGGSGGFGTVFKVNVGILNLITFTSFFDFTGKIGTRPGDHPAAGLFLSGGVLYGTTQFGGASDEGTVFKITTGNSGFTSLQQFDDTNGAEPLGALVLGSDGALYGTTSSGGANGNGTIFSVSPSTSNSLITRHTFTDEDGDVPTAGVIVGATGDFIGTTSAGGPGGNGEVFVYGNPSYFQILTGFSTTAGWRPAGTPAFDATGNSIYQPMALGGDSGAGTLLKVDAGTPAVVATFGDPLGEEPDGSLRLLSGGLFGTTKSGGNANRGTIYRYQLGGSVSTVASLTSPGGSAPEGPLTLGPDGFFYGVTREGGSASKGAILKISPSGGSTTLLSFSGTTGAAPGQSPHAPLALGADGNLYGVTERGGVNNLGTVFKLTLSGTHSLLKEFASSGPNFPLAGLTPGVAGVFYGSTAFGGSGGVGVIYKITDAGTFTSLAEFTGSSGALRGAYPVGELLYAFDGAIYGVAAESGANDSGTIFRVKADNSAETMFDFTGTTGSVLGGAPRGGLVFGNDGLLYGATEEGGPRGGGVIFRIKNLGPMAVTDSVTYGGLVATVNGRAQTNGESTSVYFEVALLPELLTLPISLKLPAQVTVANGIANFSMPVTSGLLGQLICFRARAENSSGISYGIIKNVTPLLPLQAWKTQFLGNANAPDLDDTDHDGAKNLMEYAVSNDPTVPNALPVPAPILKVYPEGARLALFLTRDPARNDITIDVQAASSPAGPWTTVATSANGAPFSGPGYVTGDGSGSGVKTVEIKDVPPANATSRVMRVVASH